MLYLPSTLTDMIITELLKSSLTLKEGFTVVNYDDKNSLQSIILIKKLSQIGLNTRM